MRTSQTPETPQDDRNHTYLQELELINTVIVKISRMDDTDKICQFMAKEIYSLYDRCVVVITLYDESINAIRVKSIEGIQTLSDKLMKLLGFDPYQFQISPNQMQPSTRRYTSGKLEKIDKGLYRILEGKVPLSICRQLENLFRLRTVYTVGFALNDKPVGGITLFLPGDQPLRYAHAIETIASHFSVMLERMQTQMAFKKIEWMLDPQKKYIEHYIPPYGDLTELNTSRLILDSVGKNLLSQISEDYIDLLGTSGAIYEKNGDYALGIFSSGWCQFLDHASRKLCKTDDNHEALKNGKWLCHESCWRHASLQAMEQKKPVDIQCHGGIHLYTLPIYAGDEIVGAINVGWGNPPTDQETLRKIASKYQVDLNELREQAINYESRPPFIIEIARKRLETSAKLIGEIVHRHRIEQQLSESREQFKTMFERSPIGIALYNNQGVLLEMNQACLDIFGVSHQDDLKKYNLFDEKRFPENVKTRLQKGNMLQFEMRIDFNDLKASAIRNPRKHDMGFFDVMMVPIKHKDQCISQFMVHIQDITERKYAEDNLKISERKFRMLVENVVDWVWQVNEKAEYIYASPQVEQLMGYSVSEVLGKTPFDFMLPDEADAVSKAFAEIAKQGASISGMEDRMMTKTGREIYFETNAAPLFDENQNLTGYMGTCRDITERKTAEDVLRESELRFRVLIENLPGGVFAHDMEGNILFVNEAACRNTGWSREELLTKTVGDIDPSSVTRDDREHLWKVMNRGNSKSRTIQSTHVRKDGTTYLTEIHLNSIILDKKRIILPIAFDISDRKKIEKEKETLISDLETKNAEMERFIYTVSHDLKSPMITIQGFLGLLRQSVADKTFEGTAGYMERISDAIKQMEHLLRDLLELSRIGRVVDISATMSMNEIVSSALTLLEGLIERNHANIEVQPGMPRVTVDRVRIQEVITNLVENAIKYAQPDQLPEIKIGFQIKNNTPVYFVQDKGIGIESKYQNKIFGLFDKLNPDTEGTGVGLALVKRIIEFHGGRIWVESNGLNKGASFKFTLPNETQEIKHETKNLYDTN